MSQDQRRMHSIESNIKKLQKDVNNLKAMVDDYSTKVNELYDKINVVTIKLEDWGKECNIHLEELVRLKKNNV